MVRILRGDEPASEHCEVVAGDVVRLRETHGVQAGLAVVMLGADPASEIYVAREV